MFYTIISKPSSSQPDIPWGVIKTTKPLAETKPEDMLYIDGYDLTWGSSSSADRAVGNANTIYIQVLFAVEASRAT